MSSTDRPKSGPFVGPRLLVSVRNTQEALAAVAGGADIIDIKEPALGSLGGASVSVIQEICRTLRSDGRFTGPISAALGELREMPPLDGLKPCLDALTWVKVGLSESAETTWQARWGAVSEAVQHVSQSPPSAKTGSIISSPMKHRLIAVAYVDWNTCGAPEFDKVIDEALARNSPGVLFDTFEKDGRSLFDHLPSTELRRWIVELRTQGRFVALAGSIGRPHLRKLVSLEPDVIAVRSAVCAGRRTGPVLTEKVAEFRAALHQVVEMKSHG